MLIFKYPFHIKYKQEIIKKILEKKIIQNLREDPSWEGGINLPLTEEWKSIDLNNKSDLKYHGSRQLRFIFPNNDNMIEGMRLKDCINYMTNYELNLIKKHFDEVISGFIIEG